MSVINFIPTIWSETLQTSMNKKYIGVANCCRDYEGEIREKGSRVKILNVGNITVANYTANTDMSSPQTLDGTSVEMVINRAKYFNFQLDDVDRAQAVPTLMSAAMDKAADALAKEADQQIYSMKAEAGTLLSCDLDNSGDLVASLLAARTKLLESGITDTNNIVIELSPKAAEILLKSEITLFSGSSDILENGCIGKFAGCKVFVTNSVEQTVNSGVCHHYCYVRSRRAIAFAEQLSEIEAYRPETRFADAVKGLHLYGTKTIYPQEFCVVDVSFAA